MSSFFNDQVEKTSGNKNGLKKIRKCRVFKFGITTRNDILFCKCKKN